MAKKGRELKHTIKELRCQIFCLQETKLCSFNQNKLWTISGNSFNDLHVKDATGSSGGLLTSGTDQRL